MIPGETTPQAPKVGVTSSYFLPKIHPTSNIAPLAQSDPMMKLPILSYNLAIHYQHNHTKWRKWDLYSKNQWTVPHTTRTSDPKYTNWWKKSTAPNFSIRRRVKIPHIIKPKEPPRKTVTLSYMMSMDTPSSTSTHMASAVTSPTAA